MKVNVEKKLITINTNCVFSMQI